MRTTAAIVLAVVLAAALATAYRFASDHSTESTPVKASTAPMLPIELMMKSNKNLPDNTVPEPLPIPIEP
jgi:hypothetical protein